MGGAKNAEPHSLLHAFSPFTIRAVHAVPVSTGTDTDGSCRPGDISYQGTGSCEDGGSRILRKAIGINPEQLHLTPWSPTSMLVSWAAGQAILGPGPATPAWSPDAVQAVVEYGTDADDLSQRANGSHNNVVYQRR